MHQLSIFLVFFIFFSCSQSDKSHPQKSVPKIVLTPLKEDFPTGQIIERVVCKTDTTQSYAMYLPKSYDSKKQYPIIYAFDAHGTGKLPVANYKDLAEKYGYILIGSNNSQNGVSWEQSRTIASKLFTDSKTRLSVNYNRVYLMGFSGGARVANALTISDNSISGVICCGAASPSATPPVERNGYTFFGIAGNEDFNYIEMKKYNFELAGRKVKHAFITFEGKHEWPESSVMNDAFFWQELNNMRKDPGSKNDTLINSNLKNETEKLKELLKQKKDVEAYQLTIKAINYFDGLADLNFFFDTYKKLKTNADIDKYLKEEEAELLKEEELQHQYISHLQTQNFEWWKKDIASINQQIKNGKGSKESLIKKRLLSYLSLVCYMQTSGALKQDNIPAAEYFGKLYILVDPTNNEAYYLMAEVNAKQGKNADALKNLEKAVENGFEDKKRLENDSAFVGLKSDIHFGKLLERIK